MRLNITHLKWLQQVKYACGESSNVCGWKPNTEKWHILYPTCKFADMGQLKLADVMCVYLKSKQNMETKHHAMEHVVLA